MLDKTWRLPWRRLAARTSFSYGTCWSCGRDQIDISTHKNERSTPSMSCPQLNIFRVVKGVEAVWAQGGGNRGARSSEWERGCSSRIECVGKWQVANLISQQVFIKSLRKTRFPHKFVNLFCVIVLTKDKLTDLCGNKFCRMTLETLSVR